MQQATLSTHNRSCRYHLVNLGCKVNRVEADRIEFDLVSHGLVPSSPTEADVIIINTCAVTGEAETKARKAVRQAIKQPQAPWVVVTGCAASLHHDAYASLGQRVLISTDKERMLSTVLDLLDLTPTEPNDSACSAIDYPARLTANRRLGIKVQDGCDNRCTYCIVWKARGPARSIDHATVIARVREAVEQGVREVVLTGINLGTYANQGMTLANLTERILDETSVQRIRLSSIEPLDITPELIDVMTTHDKRIARHIHIPLQAGSNRILHAMDRLYTAEAFMDRVNMLRAALPKIALSTDIICGFPGETKEDFSQTLTMVDLCRFAKIHVFRFSARPGTPAAALLPQLDPQIIAKRARLLRAKSLELRVADAKQRIGDIEAVLIEATQPKTQGTSDTYHRVELADATDTTKDVNVSAGDLVNVQFDFVDSTGLIHGHLI